MPLKSDVVKKDVYNGKTKDIECKIPDITNLATNTTTLNAKIMLKTKYLILLTKLLILLLPLLKIKYLTIVNI